MPRLQKLFLKSFVRIPAGLVSEPFEAFLVVLALSDCLTLLLHYFLNSDTAAFLPYFDGAVGLLIWTGIVVSASVTLVYALSTMQNHNLLAVRKLEIVGMWLYATAFGWYVYSNISVGVQLPQPIIFTVLPAVVISFLVLACVVRAISLASPITALSVTRVNRVKQIQSQLRVELQKENSSKKPGE